MFKQTNRTQIRDKEIKLKFFSNVILYKYKHIIHINIINNTNYIYIII